jgi:hypothetical protein
MAAYKKYILFLVLAGFFPFKVQSQCSDAGVCSLHSNDHGIFRRSGIGADYLNGYSGEDDSIRYESVKVAGYYWFNRQINIGAVLPLNRQTTKNGSRIQGIGDLLLVLDYLINDHPGDLTISGDNSLLTGTFEATSIQLGGKFATGAVNQANLPLRYQNGLGTNDLLLGVIYSAANPQKYNYDLFQAGFTLQIPFGIAGNKYDSLQRGIDLLGRIGYQYPIIQKFGLKSEALVIWRMTKSKLHSTVVLTPENSPDPIEEANIIPIDDNGLQVNISAAATYNYQEDIYFETGFTIPLVKRNNNIDGLKREYTLYASANYHFR